MKLSEIPYFFVFDVESVGLYGEAFAVGWVVVDRNGNELEHEVKVSNANFASGDREDREWVEKNIDLLETDNSPQNIRKFFWSRYRYWQKKGAIAAADCPYPVESKFLIECVSDDKQNRKWQAPYPLIDVGSVILARGGDPLEEFMRLPNELPKHNPLADARQSARILLTCLKDA